MLTIKEKTTRLTVVPFVAEGAGLVKELPKRNKLTGLGVFALIMCFVLGAAVAAVLLYTFF